MRTQHSIYIGRPADEVFAFVADHANDMTWRGELTGSSIVGDIAEGVGAHVHQTIAYQGRTAEASLEITDLEPDHRICFRARGGVRAHGCYDVRADGPGTLFTVSITIELKGTESMLERYVRQAVDEAAHADLERLKTVLEADGLT